MEINQKNKGYNYFSNNNNNSRKLKSKHFKTRTKRCDVYYFFVTKLRKQKCAKKKSGQENC
jgi:hypothetical protein